MNKRAERIFLFFLNFNPFHFLRFVWRGIVSSKQTFHGSGEEMSFIEHVWPIYRLFIRPFDSLSAKCSSDTASQRKFLRRSRFFRWAEGTPLNLRRSWRFEGVGRKEKTPLIRPISKNIPTVHDKTRFRSLTLFSLPSWYFSKNSSPLSIVSTVERKIFAKIRASQNFINLYTSIVRKI